MYFTGIKLMSFIIRFVSESFSMGFVMAHLNQAVFLVFTEI